MPPKRTAFDVVVDALAPYLGENMARSALRGHKDKLRVGDELPGDDLDRLLDALGPGLSVFVGRERMREIEGAVRAAVRAHRSAP